MRTSKLEGLFLWILIIVVLLNLLSVALNLSMRFEMRFNDGPIGPSATTVTESPASPEQGGERAP